MASGLAVIGFDGTAAAERAVREAGGLLAPRRALVVVAIEEGATFGAVLTPVLVAGLPATELEIRNAVRAEEAVIEQAINLAQKGAALAQEVGLEAETSSSPMTSLLRLPCSGWPTNRTHRWSWSARTGAGGSAGCSWAARRRTCSSGPGGRCWWCAIPIPGWHAIERRGPAVRVTGR